MIEVYGGKHIAIIGVGINISLIGILMVNVLVKVHIILNGKETILVLEDRFDVFKKKLIKQATDGEMCAEYVTLQIESQLTEFCRQISLFDNEE